MMPNQSSWKALNNYQKAGNILLSLIDLMKMLDPKCSSESDFDSTILQSYKSK
jgi:hypothetical protein